MMWSRVCAALSKVAFCFIEKLSLIRFATIHLPSGGLPPRSVSFPSISHLPEGSSAAEAGNTSVLHGSCNMAAEKQEHQRISHINIELLA